MVDYNKLKSRILGFLEQELPSDLYYHGTHHTLDVLKVCNDYIERDNIGPNDALLLRIGVLFHDLGFTVSFENHEENGAVLAEKILPDFGFTRKDVEIIKGLIMSTKIPQNPKTGLEEIICDSDLDYLGRDDYYPISKTLYDELRSLSKIKSERDWNQLQINFLEAHSYHTDFAIKNRQPEKEQRILELKREFS